MFYLKPVKQAHLYWFVPVILILLQANYTLHSFYNIRVEEFTDSIGGTFWLGKRTCSIYYFVGWSAILLFIFKIFGFTLYTVKYVKLALGAVSLFSLAAILKKYFGPKNAVLPLLTIGLSPTLLYYQTLQNSHGIDLIFIPILLFIVDSINFKQKFYTPLKQVLFGLLGMIAAMSYPTVIYYLPVLGIYYLYKLGSSSKDRKFILKNLSLCLISFLLPLVVVFTYFPDKSALIYDPETHLGLFRGNGQIILDWGVFLENLSIVYTDLFIYAQSYYFEAAKVEFSDTYPVLSIIFVFVVTAIIFAKKKKLRPVIILLSLTLVIGLIVSNIAGTSGGIRRSSEVLGVFYILFCFAWYFFLNQKKLSQKAKMFFLGLFSLILIHHISVYSDNLNGLNKKSSFRENVWFNISQSHQQDFDNYINEITKDDIKLTCVNNLNQIVSCGSKFGYNLIYGVIMGACEWNHLSCHNFKYFDFSKNDYQPLILDTCLKKEN